VLLWQRFSILFCHSVGLNGFFLYFVVLCVKAKGKIHLYSTTFAHTAISGAVITGRAAVQPSLQQAKLSHMDFDHMATCSHSLPYSFTLPRGMESWVRLVD